MEANILSLPNYLEQQPKVILWVTALLAMALLGLMDYLTGFEISFSFFYLLPVSLSAWAISRNAGFVLSAASGATWLMANFLAGEQLSHPLIPFWNTLMRVGFFLVVSVLISQVHRLLDQERSLARTDFLTGALNSRSFYDTAGSEIARATRYQRPLTILYIDLDNFKSVNDQMGHVAGDGVLQSVAQTITRSIRSIDSVARLGGDEFAVLLPETPDQAAKVIAPRLQQALLGEMRNNHWPITFSIGALTCYRPPLDVQQLIKLADQLMYSVKNTSKDAIVYSVYTG
jgi:diguanylate cyclase (GGDEF)-like protein